MFFHFLFIDSKVLCRLGPISSIILACKCNALVEHKLHEIFLPGGNPIKTFSCLNSPIHPAFIKKVLDTQELNPAPELNDKLSHLNV